MKLSTRSRYGLRICFAIARGGEVESLPELIKNTDLSPKYIEQILALLKKGGIIGSVRGTNGGYYLEKPPEKITMRELLDVLGDSFEIADCVSGRCGDKSCPNKSILKKMYDKIKGFLESVTLKSMLDDYENELKNV